VEHSRHKVFISYSRDDSRWVDRVLGSLRALSHFKRYEPDTIWWDGLIKAGQKWRNEIEAAIDSARVAVLLVSPGFLASQFILSTELPRLLAAAQSHGVTVVWSLLRNCNYELTPVAQYQAIVHPEIRRMRAWNTLSEAEIDDILKVLVQAVDQALGQEPGSATAPVPELRPEPGPETVGNEIPDPVDDERQILRAEELTHGVEDARVMDDLGNLFLLRKQWRGAETVYDRLIDLAAPYDERWMAWGYERLGAIRQRRTGPDAARECRRLARHLYHRLGETEKAEEMDLLLASVG
jgi:hypothetical protein